MVCTSESSSRAQSWRGTNGRYSAIDSIGSCPWYFLSTEILPDREQHPSSRRKKSTNSPWKLKRRSALIQRKRQDETNVLVVDRIYEPFDITQKYLGTEDPDGGLSCSKTWYCRSYCYFTLFTAFLQGTAYGSKLTLSAQSTIQPHSAWSGNHVSICSRKWFLVSYAAASWVSDILGGGGAYQARAAMTLA